MSLLFFFTIIFINPSFFENAFSDSAELIKKNKNQSEEIERLGEKLDHQKNKIEELSQIANEDKAKKLCEDIVKVKNFYFPEKRKYIFTIDEISEKYGFRATAVEGFWDVDVKKSCKSSGTGQQLAGIDISVHLIEIIQDGKFEAIGHAIAKYNSTLKILSDGKFGDRKIGGPQSMNFIYLPGIQESKELKDKICGDYNLFREAVHSQKVSFRGIKIDASQPCVPTMGERSGQTIFAFICGYYTRIMEEDNDHDQRKQDLATFADLNYCNQ